jgi:hypothetical protein
VAWIAETIPCAKKMFRACWHGVCCCRKRKLVPPSLYLLSYVELKLVVPPSSYLLSYMELKSGETYDLV